jgi:hypothetical protein
VPSLAVEDATVEPGGTALLTVTAENASAIEVELPTASADAPRLAAGDAQASPSASYALPGEAPVWVWSGRPERVELLVPVTVGPDVAPGDYRVRVRASPTPGSSLDDDAVTGTATVRVVRSTATQPPTVRVADVTEKNVTR